MRPLAERWLRAMGTDVHLTIVGPRAASMLGPAVRRVHELESRWSRFVPSSEVSLLNASAGSFVDVSNDTVVLVERAIDAWKLTGGSFDPTMGNQIVEAGYDRPFDEIVDLRREKQGVPAASVGPEDIAIDRRRGAIRLPEGIAFDPGGIGKGLAADLLTAELVAIGAAGAMVNLGGDLAVRGLPPEGDEWVVAVREPTLRDSPIATTRLVAGGLATSTTCRRRWRMAGHDRHHILDARTGSSSEPDAILATVIAGEAWWAEAAATAMLSGPNKVPPRCASLRMFADGTIERDVEFDWYAA